MKRELAELKKSTMTPQQQIDAITAKIREMGGDVEETATLVAPTTETPAP